MRTIITIVLTFFFTLNFQAQNPDFDNTRLKEINKWIVSDVEKGEMQGAIIMIANKDEVIYSYTGGQSNIQTKRSLQKDDYFKIASMSKVITTVGVLQLYEKGLLDLNDPISKFLPEFKDLKVLHSEKESDSLLDAKSEVTIKQLLTHTSGFGYGGPKLSKLYKEKEISFFNPKESNLEEFMKKLSQMPLVAQPGSKFTYGPSTDILGYLIEKLTNTDLETYFEKHIFKPLGMHHTGFNAHRHKAEKLVRTYRVTKEGELKLHNKPEDFNKDHFAKVFMGGSGLISTASDYLKFSQMLLNNGNHKGQNILSRKSIELMTRNQIQDIKYPQGYNRLLGEGNTFGLGLNVITEQGSTNELYSQGSYFWEGSYTTSFIVDPKEGFTAVIMTQIGGRKSLDIRKKFRKYIYSALK